MAIHYVNFHTYCVTMWYNLITQFGNTQRNASVVITMA